MRKPLRRLCVFLACMGILLTGCKFSADTNAPDVSGSSEREPESTPSHATASCESSVTEMLAATPTILPEEADLLRAEEILSTMTLEEKVGQMFFVRYSSANMPQDVSLYHLGGIILFACDCENETPDSLVAKINDNQMASQIPLLVGVDEEGGDVVRVSKYTQFRSEPFMSPQEIYAAGGLDAIRADASEKADFLLTLGINVNLAPVCDVSDNPSDYIYSRAFGQAASETAEYVSSVVTEMVQADCGCVLKHFPGYGNNANTHTGIATDTREMSVFESSDFLPFEAGIEAGAEAVMVSHNIVTCMDPDLPASLSPAVHSILRDELSFDGVIMTDDLAMDAITTFCQEDAAAVLAVLAGNDMIVCTDYQTQIPAVLTAVSDGTLSEAQIDAAVTRILLWKIHLGLLT